MRKKITEDKEETIILQYRVEFTLSLWVKAKTVNSRPRHLASLVKVVDSLFAAAKKRHLYDRYVEAHNEITELVVPQVKAYLGTVSVYELEDVKLYASGLEIVDEEGHYIKAETDY